MRNADKLPAIPADSKSYPEIAAAKATGVPVEVRHEVARMLLRDMRGGDLGVMSKEPRYERAMTRALFAAGGLGVSQFIKRIGRHYREAGIATYGRFAHMRRPLGDQVQPQSLAAPAGADPSFQNSMLSSRSRGAAPGRSGSRVPTNSTASALTSSS